MSVPLHGTSSRQAQPLQLWPSPDLDRRATSASRPDCRKRKRQDVACHAQGPIALELLAPMLAQPGNGVGGNEIVRRLRLDLGGLTLRPALVSSRLRATLTQAGPSRSQSLHLTASSPGASPFSRQWRQSNRDHGLEVLLELRPPPLC